MVALYNRYLLKRYYDILIYLLDVGPQMKVITVKKSD